MTYLSGTSGDAGEEGRAWLAREGYDAEFGARPLRRLIQNEIEDRLSDGILSGEFTIGSTVSVSANEEDELTLTTIEELPEPTA